MQETQTPSSLNDRIAQRVRELRAARGLSLDALATHCGVSRSMISLIERGESSPTAVLLEKLATGLGVSLASLFDAPSPMAEPEPVARAADQPQWRDPHSGYVRRNVSPGGISLADPGGRGAVSAQGARGLRNRPRASRVVHQQVWVLEGVIDITLGDEQHRLQAGDCLAMVLDRPMSYYNPTRKTTRYAVVIATGLSSSAR
jgi:transcriptional regulator with XRE-family HTH domain